MQSEPVSVRVNLLLPRQTIEAYDRRAANRNQSLESEISTTLRESEEWTSKQPIYLSDQERMRLEKVLARNLSNSRQLVDAIEKLGRIRLPTGVQINLSETAIARLKSRCPRREHFSLFLERTVRNLLEQYVGLR